MVAQEYEKQLAAMKKDPRTFGSLLLALWGLPATKAVADDETDTVPATWWQMHL